MYPDFQQFLLLTLANAEGGIVSTDTCNAAQWVNTLLIDKIKLEHDQKIKNGTIDDSIIGGVDHTVRTVEDD